MQLAVNSSTEGALLLGVASHQGRDAVAQLLEELLVDPPLDKDPAGAEADLPLVEEGRPGEDQAGARGAFTWSLQLRRPPALRRQRSLQRSYPPAQGRPGVTRD